MCLLTVFSHNLIAYLEKDYALGLAQGANKADAIVVLSGMVRTIDGTDGLVYEWGEASDRIFAGIDLFAEGKAVAKLITKTDNAFLSFKNLVPPIIFAHKI